MKIYSQRDPKWAKMLLGDYPNLPMEKFGCYVVAISILDGRNPAEILRILNSKNAFTKAGFLRNDVAANALGFTYEYAVSRPDYPCIAETDHYKNQGFEQHFFVLLPSGKIIDPLTGEEKVNDYHIVSYRLWRKKSEPKVEYATVIPTPTIIIEKVPTFWEKLWMNLVQLYQNHLAWLKSKLNI